MINIQDVKGIFGSHSIDVIELERPIVGRKGPDAGVIELNPSVFTLQVKSTIAL